MNPVAQALVETKAVHLKKDPEEYFTWTSGRKSPIYCDNRQIISYPEYRKTITHKFCKLINEDYSDCELIAATATAGIPWGAWIADQLNLPLVYIRSKPKGHGLQTAIEGRFLAGQKTLIIEDLISTGKSSLEAYAHCQQAELDTLAVLSIFNYGFKDAVKNFSDHALAYQSLCDVETMLDYAQASKLIDSEQAQAILHWRDTF
ncbi:MAG: orotate phosphoribosyltransferase [Halobacteriovoraceae bacterium]|nr:orotate phosphoribosyltransferase [Halobacteriovoraceae bacterium]|tara:strand:+ start:1531 stop:2142 length:612 start_codon:yes stop_codon:yes gene_type:complete